MSLLPCIYDAKVRAKIAKLMEEDDLKRATQLAAKELGNDVRKSTVHSICNMYQKHLASARLEPQAVAEMLTKQHGCLLYIEWDLYHNDIFCESGCVVNQYFLYTCKF